MHLFFFKHTKIEFFIHFLNPIIGRLLVVSFLVFFPFINVLIDLSLSIYVSIYQRVNILLELRLFNDPTKMSMFDHAL
jgi:hypothetical protein